jgi:hypothetical protein
MRATVFLLAALLALALSTPAMSEDVRSGDHAAHAQLTLDHGRKWIADKDTIDTVAAMKSAVQKVSGVSPRPSPAEMRTAGANLQELLQALIRGCTMDGASHEQLHTWISALAPQIEKLRTSEVPQDGYAAIEKISEILRSFDGHFQAGS